MNRSFLSLFALVLCTIVSPAFAVNFSAYHIGNSLTQDMDYRIFPKLANTYETTQIPANTYSWGYHFRPGTSLTYMYNNPTDATSRSAVGLAYNSAQPTTNLVPWNTALPNNHWDAVTMQTYPGGGTDGPATLASDTNAINGMIAATKTRADNASGAAPTRFFIYAAWPNISYSDLNSNSTKWLTSTPNLPTESSVLSRSYFADVTAAVRLTNPGVSVIPVGEVLNALDIKMRAGEIPGFTSVRDLHRDDNHLNAIGKNIASYTTYAVIFKQSPVGLPKDYFADGIVGSYTNNDATPEAMTIMQQTVWDVVNQQNFYTNLPEPTAGALLLGGFCLLGMRRRKRAA